MEQEEQPSFRRYVEDRRYYEVPARFAMHTAYMEVSNMQWWPVFLYLVIVSYCNFQLSVEYNPGFLWFCFISLCNWSRKLASLSQPIRCKTKTNRDLVTCVFPRFGYLRFPAFWLHAFSRALVSLPVSSQRLFSLFLVCHWDYNGFGLTTLNRKELFIKAHCHFTYTIAVSSIGREILADKRGC